ncbi:MAG TPA: formylglycine-generating enzyme family protein [Chthoniobacterales bacterium]
MLDLLATPSVDLFPDDPLKWDGWRNYDADNLYERLCLNSNARPNEEQIQQHCAALLQWWQKKLRLKNQPNNPITQLLGRGIDDAPACLIEARIQLLDPERRRQIDDALVAQSQQEALADFCKYVAFSLARRVLTVEAEANLVIYGQRNGLTEEQTRACIEEELQRHKAKRVAPAAAATSDTTPALQTSNEAEQDFHRILRLSHLNLADATPLVRQIFATIAENLGIRLERAEYLLDEYLDRNEARADVAPALLQKVRLKTSPPKNNGAAQVKAPPPSAPPSVQPVVRKTALSGAPPEFMNPAGMPMVLIPTGDFMMGSEAPDAPPNEQPVIPVVVNEFYMSRFLVTNAQYERFDPRHRQKRMSSAGDDHPVVYVTSLEADRYCQWLGLQDGKVYRLPMEAEWEYAARGTDGRKFPWGNHERRGGFANFADASTAFPWRDPQINDGYPETSPVGAFPRGASFFGLEDMAGNVWEWCLDFYEPEPGPPKRNPRAFAASTQPRVYRGGSWKSRFSNLRATARSSNAANYASNDVGFRIVCECGSRAEVRV